MKMKKMAGALALSAALAMGTAMPAFAASATTDTAFSGTDGSTEIKASVEDTMLKATVPLHVAIVFGAASGTSAITAPQASTYAISNTGDGDIYVIDATIENGAAAAAAGLTIAGWSSAEGVYGAADPTPQMTTDGKYVMLTYSDGTNYTYLAPDHPLSDAKTTKAVYDKEYIAEAVGGASPAATTYSQVKIAAGEKLPIQLGGKTSFGVAVDNSDLTDTLCTIKYTISKTKTV